MRSRAVDRFGCRPGTIRRRLPLPSTAIGGSRALSQPGGAVAARHRRNGVEADQFGQPQARRVEQFEHRVIAQTFGRRGGRAFHQARGVVDGKCFRQCFRLFRRPYGGDRVGRQIDAAREPAVKRSPARCRMADRARRQAACVRAGDGAANVDGRQVLQRPALGQQPQFFEFVGVAAQRMRRQSPLMFEIRQVGGNRSSASVTKWP